jgi:poly(3-hydroxybutyrate) depolymerase
MLYHLYELNRAALSPARAAADAYRLLFRNPLNPAAYTPLGRSAAAALELFERTTRRYPKPSWNIDRTEIKGRRVAVRERVVISKPFCNLIHFERNVSAWRRHRDPKLLIVAPLAGHFSTLLRGTVRDLLPLHDIYVAEWQDARFVPRAEGSFDVDDYIDYIVEFLQFFGGDVHVMAVCQPTVPVFAAVSLMETNGDPAVPRSMILMAGPIDARENPTAVNRFAGTRSIEWFRRNVITQVPWPYPGVMRNVYPGLPPAQRLHGHEFRPPRHGASRPFS